MCAEFARCGMVGKHGNGYRFVPILHGLVDRPYYPLVEILDGELLQLEVAFVSGLIARLDMQINQIVRFQCIKSSIHLILIIRVVKTGGTFYIDASQTGIHTDAIDQVHGRDNRPFLNRRIHHRERFHLRTIPRTPRPNAIGRVLAFGHALQIQGMIFQKLLRFQNQVIEQIRGFLRLRHFGFHHERTERMQGHIVRRGTIHMLIASLDDQKMAILHTGMELHTFVAQVFL